jgi:hypothetical protein
MLGLAKVARPIPDRCLLATLTKSLNYFGNFASPVSYFDVCFGLFMITRAASGEGITPSHSNPSSADSCNLVCATSTSVKGCNRRTRYSSLIAGSVATLERRGRLAGSVHCSVPPHHIVRWTQWNQAVGLETATRTRYCSGPAHRPAVSAGDVRGQSGDDR